MTSKETNFRDDVYDLHANMSFAEQFYLSSRQETDRFMHTGTVGTEAEIVKARIKSYFSAQPESGERYLKYMDTEDKSLLTEADFVFIALAQGPEKMGLIAIDLDAIDVIA